ncbi:hypothetical protein ABZX98_19225 [Streptomyces sp. NPDC002992]|uniref:hypothetical protein n=1 Tax=Streptomyces sp. NPDC002992 TaxID=3154273 RepID=UPI0033AD3EE7
MSRPGPGKPAKKYPGMASTTPGGLGYMGSRPNTSPRSSEHPDTRRRPQGPTAS